MDLFNRVPYSVEAETPHEAMRLAKAAHPDYTIDLITDGAELSESPDRCDGCGEYLLEGEVAAYEPDQGNSYCKDCNGAMLDEQANYEPEVVKLCGALNEAGELTDLDVAQNTWTVVKFLIEQNHTAESIACHLQLNSMFYGYVPDLAEALIEKGLCKC